GGGDALGSRRLRGQADRPARAGREGGAEPRRRWAPLVKILARVQDPELPAAVSAACSELDAELILVGGGEGEVWDRQLLDALRSHPALLVLEARLTGPLKPWRTETRTRNTALVVACEGPAEVELAVGAEADEWVLLPASAAELRGRFQSALARVRHAARPEVAARMAEHLRYEELLYDRFTGFPTLPVMLERGREMLDRTGRVTILYIEFQRYSKLEEIYGWQKLDEVLQTTANAVRGFYDRRHGEQESLMMVSHTGDDDFIFFTDLPETTENAELRLNEVAEELETHIRARLE